MNSAQSHKTNQVDLEAICSSVYKDLTKYSNAMQGQAIVSSGHDTQLIGLLATADRLGRKLVTHNFEKSASPKILFRHLHYYNLIQQLVQVIKCVNQYSLKHTGCKWEVPIHARQGSPYASAVITAICNEIASLNGVKIKSYHHASFMGVEGGVVKQVKGTETLFKILNNINLLIRQDAKSAANNFDQSIKRAYTSNLKYLNGLLHENHKLHFVRVFLPMVGEPNEDEQFMSERLRPRLGKFSNRWRRKRTVFGGCVGYRKGEIFKWDDLIGSEFIFFFKGDQLGFNFGAVVDKH